MASRLHPFPIPGQTVDVGKEGKRILGEVRLSLLRPAPQGEDYLLLPVSAQAVGDVGPAQDAFVADRYFVDEDSDGQFSGKHVDVFGNTPLDWHGRRQFGRRAGRLI